MTERYAMAVRLKDEKRDFYLKNHANVWPEVLSELSMLLLLDISSANTSGKPPPKISPSTFSGICLSFNGEKLMTSAPFCKSHSKFA